MVTKLNNQSAAFVPLKAQVGGDTAKHPKPPSDRLAGNSATLSPGCDIGDWSAHIFGTGAWHAAALNIARGASRFLRAQGCAVVAEFSLADGRRADLVALDTKGCITILEVKSCLADFRTDSKWEDYRQWCDRFYFAVDTAFPQDIIPEDCGLIIADRYGAEALRDAPEHRLKPVRRKAVTLRFARCAAFRLQGADDPDMW